MKMKVESEKDVDFTQLRCETPTFYSINVYIVTILNRGGNDIIERQTKYCFEYREKRTNQIEN